MAHKTVRLKLELDAELSVYCNLPNEGGYTLIGNPPHAETDDFRTEYSNPDMDDFRTVHPDTETDGFRNVPPKPGEQEPAYPDFTAMRGEGCIVICRTGARPQGCIITAQRTVASDGREAQVNTFLRWMGRIPDLPCCLHSLRDEANRLAGEKIREWEGEGSGYDSEAKGLPRNAPEDDRMQENMMQTLTLQAEPLKGEPSKYLLAEMLSAAENRHPCVILESQYSWNEFLCALACLLDAAEQEEERSLSIGYAPPEGAGLMDINYWPAKSRGLDREVKCCVRQIAIPERGKSYAEPEYMARARELIRAYNTRENGGRIRKNSVQRSAANHDTAKEHPSESGGKSSRSHRSAYRRGSTSENGRSSGRGSSSERKPSSGHESSSGNGLSSGRRLSFRRRLSAAAGPLSLSCAIAITTLILAVSIHSSSGMIVLFEDGSELASLAVGCIWGYILGTLRGPHRK